MQIELIREIDKRVKAGGKPLDMENRSFKEQLLARQLSCPPPALRRRFAKHNIERTELQWKCRVCGLVTPTILLVAAQNPEGKRRTAASIKRINEEADFIREIPLLSAK